MRRQRRHDEHMEEELAKEGGEENVVVCIRVRPFNRRELELQRVSGDSLIRSVIEMPEGMGGKVVAMERQANGDYTVAEEFQYTKSFWSVPEEQQPYPFAPVTQEDVFEVVGKPVLKYAFVGFNNCVFAYGQTGSGKTHTMMGDFTEQDGQFIGDAGLIPRLCRELFSKLEEKKALYEEGIEKSFDVKLSAIEIYNEQVRDLFWRQTPGRAKNTVMKVRMHPVEGAFVDQLTILNPNSWQHCVRLIAAGVNERTVAATLMNDESSRSHSVFTIVLSQSETVHVVSDDPEDRYTKPVTNTKVSRINLVDLAGSERLKKSGAQGQNLKEAATINQSLSTLKKVIDALVSNSKEPNVKKHVVIPFRESMLTMLLSTSLGGNSKTTMIACVSPHHDNQEETLLTLRYANRAKGIVNHTRVNEDSAAKQALALKHQILALQKRLSEGEDEQTEELIDQLEVGREALKSLEEQNKVLESQAQEMKSRTKQEEGARYAAAFYNSLKMVMLQQQREQLEASIQDMEARLVEEERESKRLRDEVDASEALTSEQEKAIARLQREERDHLASEVEQLKVHGKLRSESEQVTKKLHHEMELRYAQKLVNARKIHRTKLGHQEVLAKVQERHDMNLTSVIFQAAEQYEQEVRQYADADTAVSQRITKCETEIPLLVSKRETLERQAGDLHLEIRNNERAHLQRIDQLDVSWKERYAAMKTSREAQIAALEQEMTHEQLKFDELLDEDAVHVSREQQNSISELQGRIREKEIDWASRAATACTDEADALEERTRSATKEQAERLALRERKMQLRIAHLVKHFREVSTYCDELDRAVGHIDAQTGPVVRPYDDVTALKLESSASPELRHLYSLLHGHESSHRSVAVPSFQHPVDRHTTAPGARLRVSVPSSAFYPMPASAPSAERSLNVGSARLSVPLASAAARPPPGTPLARQQR